MPFLSQTSEPLGKAAANMAQQAVSKVKDWTMRGITEPIQSAGSS